MVERVDSHENPNPGRMQYKGKYLEEMSKPELIAALVHLGNLCMARQRDEDDAEMEAMLGIARGGGSRRGGVRNEWVKRLGVSEVGGSGRT